MEGGRQVRAAHAEVESNGLPHIGRERVVAGNGSHGAVEHDVVGSLVDGLDHAERLEAGLSTGSLGVEIALHDVVLAVHLRQALLRLDQDQTVHAVADVHGHRGRGAVIDIEAGVQGLEREHRAVTGSRERGRRTAAGPGDRVQIDVVGHLVVGVVVEVELDEVALADADELARDLAAKGPERVANTVGDRHLDFRDLETDDHLRRVLPGDRRRHGRRVGQYGSLLALNRLLDVLIGPSGRRGNEREREGHDPHQHFPAVSGHERRSSS